jgi:YARHG domain-containing protein
MIRAILIPLAVFVALVDMTCTLLAQTGLTCDELWYERNSIFKAAGYCFKTPRAISAFGNSRCAHQNVRNLPLSPRDRQRVKAIQLLERDGACIQQDTSAEHDAICRGVLTVNWTETVQDNTPDDGTRLVRADEINNSCLFHKDSDVGRKILGACRMGYSCEVKARVNGESSDVFYIVRVYSVRRIH